MLIRKCDICGSMEQEGNGRYHSYTVPSCRGYSIIVSKSIDLCRTCETKIANYIFKLEQGKGEVIDGND